MADINHAIIWQNCLQIIKDNIPSISFQTWFKPIVPIKVNKNILTIQVPSPFFYEYLEEQYIEILRMAIKKELGPEANLEYSVVVDQKVHSMQGSQNGSFKVPGKTGGTMPTNQVNMPPKDENTIRNPFVIPGIKKIVVPAQLNQNYTINNFVEGECNRLARAAGIEIINNPGRTPYNPLMIYGDSGLGKTHLIQAIGNSVKERYPEKAVLYVSANRFQTQYSDSVRNNNRNDFMHFYQMIDVLIIDDVQEFAGKQGTQDIFFHIFNHLHQSNKQLILSSDRPPVELKGLNKRLLSRFKWGLTADLQMPEYETRLAILQRKVYNDGLSIPNEVLEYIATNVTTSIRELEGALISVLAQSTLNRKEITLDLGKHLLDKIVKKTKHEFSVDYIQKVVCEYFDIDPKVLSAKTRKREIVQARQIAMYFSKSMTNSSLATIGAQIGGKDHSTVLHACKTVADLLTTDKNFKNYVDDIERKLKF